MANKLFVGGLSWNTDSEGLRKAFEAHGELTEVTVVKDNATGRSRGFGFVVFANAEDAKKALAMNGTTLDGRTIQVDEARPPRERSHGGGGRDDRGGYNRGGG